MNTKYEIIEILMVLIVGLGVVRIIRNLLCLRCVKEKEEPDQATVESTKQINDALNDFNDATRYAVVGLAAQLDKDLHGGMSEPEPTKGPVYYPTNKKPAKAKSKKKKKPSKKKAKR